MKTAIELITEERNRQITEEKWSPEHDNAHKEGELAGAAACYALQAAGFSRPDKINADRPPVTHTVPLWPWADGWWKPSDDQVRNLVKAGALIVSEIDRLQRKGADQ